MQLPEDVPAGCEAFGRALLDRGDLDPVYTLIRAARLPPSVYAQTVLGYLMFYHLGVAARLGEAPRDGFYDLATSLLDYAPRGTERRHFRGKLARDSLRSLARAGCADFVVARMCPAGADFGTVYREVQTFTGFGPWIAFKAADLFDRTGWARLPVPIDTLTLYRDPLKGIALYLHRDAERWKELSVSDVYRAVEDLLERLSDRLAPPDYRRPLGVAEAETVFCKYKSHLNGHYPPGKDVEEVVHGLAGWGDLAEEFQRCAILC